MTYLSIFLSLVSLFLSIKVMKSVKQKAVSAAECKNALNQRVVSSVKEYDKKGKQIVYAAVKFDGDEVEHILVNIQDLSSISVEEGT